jgi:23S rRNA (uracil1939-C5)-methyltransferase
VEKITLNIEYLNSEGFGVGIWNNRKVLVAHSLPGENVTVAITKKNTHYLQAKLTHINEASPERVSPPCPYFNTCGGCNMQHLNHKAYYDFKRDLLAQTVKDLWTKELPDPVIIGPHVRRRASFKARLLNKKLKFGYYKPLSHEIVDIDECLVLAPVIVQIFASLKIMLGKFSPSILQNTLEIFVTLCDNGLDLMIRSEDMPALQEQELLAEFAATEYLSRISWQTQGEEIPILTKETPSTQFGSTQISLPTGAFLQASKESERAIINIIIPHIAPGSRVIDLYAGCGTYSFAVADHAYMHAVEGSKAMVDTLLKYATQVKFKLTAEQRDLFRNPLEADYLNKFDAIIINPPRNGASAQATRIANSKVPKVIMVSCNPKSFRSDAKLLYQGGYQLTNIHAVDQFHWNKHLEIIGIFERVR